MKLSVKKIELVFENVESVGIEREAIEDLKFIKIRKKPINTSEDGEGLRECERVRIVFNSKLFSTELIDLEGLHMYARYSESELLDTVREHFTVLKDVVSIRAHYGEGKVIHVAVPWGEDENYYSYNLQNSLMEFKHDKDKDQYILTIGE